jgi:hypothetical protein
MLRALYKESEMIARRVSQWIVPAACAMLFTTSCGSNQDSSPAGAGAGGAAGSSAGGAGGGAGQGGTSSTDGFKDSTKWSVFDASKIGGLVTRGYYGAVSDGRYVYYAPCRTQDFHGIVLRYDSQAEFTATGSWQSYDAGSTDGLKTKGYAGTVFDGRYVYFVPYANQDATESVRHARVLRYDTQQGFSTAASWSAYDASGTNGIPAAQANFLGYDGAVFDGVRYVYFVPYGDQTAAQGWALRMDTQGDFKAATSWVAYDVSSTGGLASKGYYGGAFDGRYVYYVPFANGPDAFHGIALRHDTQSGAFKLASTWQAYDASNTDGMKTIGYKGAVFDGRYVYYVPFREAEGVQHTRVLRFDTQANFTDSASWSAFDAANTDGLDTRGYVGAVFDGRFVYFIPYQQDTTFHANVLRYDTKGDFKAGASWSGFNAGGIGGLNTKGYKYAVYMAPYIFFAPYNNNDAFSGIAIRYNTQ